MPLSPSHTPFLAPFLAARAFVRTALSALRTIEAAGPVFDLGDFREELHLIKQAARPVKAKAVYRAAQACETVAHTTAADQQSRLLALGTVIRLYCDGLLEIDPDFALELAAEFAPEQRQGLAVPNRQDLSAALLPPRTESQPEEPEIPENLQDPENLAGAVLELREIDIFIPKAEAGLARTQREALSGARAAPVRIKPDGHSTTSTLVAANENARALLEPLISFAGDEGLQASLHVLAQYRDGCKKNTTVLSAPRRIQQNFDDIMRQMTSRILAEARLAGQDVSISYAATFDGLDMDLARNVQAALLAASLAIVRTGLPHTPAGAVKSAAHLGVTGTQTLQGYRFELSWHGRALNKSEAEAGKALRRVREILIALDGSLEIEALPDGPQKLQIICPLKRAARPDSPLLHTQHQMSGG